MPKEEVTGEKLKWSCTLLATRTDGSVYATQSTGGDGLPQLTFDYIEGVW